MIFRLIIVFLCCIHCCFSQDSTRYIQPKWTGKVVDSQTLEPCPYVRIYNHSAKTGVLTEFNGYFELIQPAVEDSVSLFSTGYKRIYTTAAQLMMDSVIYLVPEVKSIEEVIILADDSRLYQWFDQVFDHKEPIKKAKTYFQLETYLDETQVELYEAYYNATISGTTFNKLDYKSGRAALRKDENDQTFVSIETSKAILQLRLTEQTDFLPLVPFSYNTKKMRRLFKLQLNQTYTTADNHVISVISFYPRDSTIDAFSGTIWIDTLTKQAQKLVLTALSTNNHPFLPIAFEDSISHVNLSINYVFKDSDNSTTIDFLYYDYAFDYQNQYRDRYTVKTAVVVHPYNYDSVFFTPIFKGAVSSFSDYRKIQIYPYNGDFWKHIEHPISQENSESNSYFFEQQDFSSTKVVEGIPKEWSFGTNLVWGTRRLGIADNLSERNLNKSAPPSSQYQLVAQVLLDLNNYNGKLVATTYTVLDPFQTFYYLPVDPYSECFLNIYLDLVEIERRKFMQELAGKDFSSEHLFALYETMNTTIERTSARYFKEADHGTNRKALEKWNAIVLEGLGIDNVAFFKLYQEEEE